jgi:DNA-directed RNA polymerase specialized sigma24 family protein
VELVRRYSNHADLQERLSQAARKITPTTDQDQEPPDDTSVSGRDGRAWKVSDRLSDELVEAIIERFLAGEAKHALATRYGVSLSSIKRLLRQKGVRRNYQS